SKLLENSKIGRVGIGPKCLSITEPLAKWSRRAGKEVAEGMESCPLLDFVLRGIFLEAKDRSVPVNCPNPNCSENLLPDQCENILPGETLDKWRLVQEEVDSRALLLKDDAPNIMVNQSEFPGCKRLFCVQCGVPWHVGFPALNFRAYFRKNKMIWKSWQWLKREWQRCLACRSLVEKVSGCSHMTC
ncbi:hypothetical protein KI387_009993, partial [Taxus chinensis]